MSALADDLLLCSDGVFKAVGFNVITTEATASLALTVLNQTF